MAGEPDSGAMISRVEAAMARVRARIHGEAPSPPAVPGRSPRDSARLLPEDAYRSLHQARTIGGAIGVSYALGWRTPIVGPIWMMLRRRIHQEIRIYIDALTAQQSNLNAHTIRILTLLIETLEGLGLPALQARQAEQEQLIAALQQEVRELRSEVAGLRACPSVTVTDAIGNPPIRN